MVRHPYPPFFIPSLPLSLPSHPTKSTHPGPLLKGEGQENGDGKGQGSDNGIGTGMKGMEGMKGWERREGPTSKGRGREEVGARQEKGQEGKGARACPTTFHELASTAYDCVL